jgi:hypothetical protein
MIRTARNRYDEAPERVAYNDTSTLWLDPGD